MAIQTGLLLVARQCRDVACSVRLVLSLSDAERPYHASALPYSQFPVFRFHISVFHISVRSILK